MNTSAPSDSSVHGYSTSIRTGRGRLTVHVDVAALLKLGASDGDPASLLATLSRHMPRFHALALQLAAQGRKTEVTVGPAQVWWAADEGIERTRGEARAH